MKKKVFVFFLASLCVGGMTFLSSCLKNSSNTPSQPSSAVWVLQASPGSPSLNVYFNTANQGAIAYAQGGWTPPVKVGNYNFSFVNSSTGDTVSQVQDSIQAGSYYSLVLYDTGSMRKVMLFKDQSDQSQGNTDALVNFLQLSPDSHPVTVNVDSVTVFPQRTFADNVGNPNLSKFTGISQGTHSFTALNASNGDTLGTLSNVALQAGKIYTVFLRGLASHTSDTLGVKLDIMQNFP